MSIEAKLQELGWQLPQPTAPKGLYRPLTLVGSLAFTAGHLPTDAEGQLITGRLGDDMDIEAGAEAARRTAMAILATLQAELGSLDRVRRIVKLTGLVRCNDTFDQQPAVLNGASQVFLDLFGPSAGVPSRTAAGTNALPLGAVVEIEAIIELTPLESSL